MGISNNQELFLYLIRLGIGHESVQGTWTSQAAEPSARFKVQGRGDSGTIDWNVLEELAAKQGLSAVLVDGIELLPDELRPPKLVLLQWIGQTLQGYEYRYEQYRKAIGEMAAFYNSHGFKMMLLKGYACSQDWPRPEHRPCGDIDIWQFGRQAEADKTLEAEMPVQVVRNAQEFNVDKSHHHHTVFFWRDFMVENHYDFINVHHHRSHVGLEKVFKELGRDDSHVVEVYGEKIYIPSPNLHALFLIRHALNHFASIGISLRQVLDWAFFVEKHTTEVDWKWLNEMMEQYHMIELYNCLNAICVEDLGFDANIFHGVRFNPVLKDRVLQDILNPEYGNDLPKYLIPRLLFKYKRWRGNAWKREFCYNESRWVSFSNGLWRHLVKPEINYSPDREQVPIRAKRTSLERLSGLIKHQ